MLPYTNQNSTSGAPAAVFNPNPALVNGSTTNTNAGCSALFLWNATARTLYDDLGTGNPVIAESARTSTTCYIKGLSEHIRIQTSSPLPWFYRRVVFCLKFDSFSTAESSPLFPPRDYYVPAGTTGPVRSMYNFINNNTTPLSLATIQSFMFKGRGGSDWNEMIIAPLDHRRIDVKYDKTFTIKSSTSTGTVKEFKFWHPLNKNIVYQDDENNGGMDSTPTSVLSKPGMGNLFVVDIVSPGIGSAPSDLISINPSATLYWHEK